MSLPDAFSKRSPSPTSCQHFPTANNPCIPSQATASCGPSDPTAATKEQTPHTPLAAPSAEYRRSLHHVQAALTQHFCSWVRSLHTHNEPHLGVRHEMHRTGLCTHFHEEGGIQARESPWGNRVPHPEAGRLLAHG